MGKAWVVWGLGGGGQKGRGKGDVSNTVYDKVKFLKMSLNLWY